MQPPNSESGASAIGRQQWDRLACHWALFEQGGLNETHLAQVASFLKPPLLVVGAGQGQLVQACLEQGLDPVVGVDFSREMVRLALSRRRLKLLEADADDLPVADGAFQTIICASGVLDPSDDQQVTRCAAEFRRVAVAGASLVTAFLAPGGERFKVGSRLGIFDGATQCNDRIVQLWLARHEPRRQVEWVRSWTGTSAAAAEAALQDGRQLLDAWYDLFDRFQRHSGEVPEHFAWRLNGLDSQSPPPGVTGQRWRHRTSLYDAELMLQVMVFQAE